MNRIESIREKLSERDGDGIILFSTENRRYATGVKTSDGYVIITKKSAYLLVDFRYIELARESADGFEVRLLSGSRKELFEEILKSENVNTLLFEPSEVTVEAMGAMEKLLPDIKFAQSGGFMKSLRSVKDESELDAIKRAQTVTDKAFEHILGYIGRDKTEAQVALELDYTMRRLGADGNAFDTICVSGRKSSLPHGVPSDVRLSEGFLTMDFGARMDGYCSDMTRTVVLGKTDGRMREIYGIVLEAQAAALSKIKAGVIGSEVDAAARDLITKAGYGECFGHSTGHSLGMDIHESPNFAMSCGTPIPAGTVMSVEPGIYIEGSYGVRIEDIVCVTDNGYINLTKSKKELIELA
ncbi:MAG: M24 family metallopeptidase [Eubacteriales bacterium]